MVKILKKLDYTNITNSHVSRGELFTVTQAKWNDLNLKILIIVKFEGIEIKGATVNIPIDDLNTSNTLTKYEINELIREFPSLGKRIEGALIGTGIKIGNGDAEMWSSYTSD